MKRTFDPHPTSARAVRRFVEEALPSSRRRDEIVLAASELATIVIRHARRAYTVCLEVADRMVHLEVSVLSTASAFQDGDGERRRLRVLGALCRDWGIQLDGLAVTLWADFDQSPEPNRRDSRLAGSEAGAPG